MMMSGSPSPHAVNAIAVPSAETATALTFSVIWDALPSAGAAVCRRAARLGTGRDAGLVQERQGLPGRIPAAQLGRGAADEAPQRAGQDRKSTRLNSSHSQ